MQYSKPEPKYADVVVWQYTECKCWSKSELLSDDMYGSVRSLSLLTAQREGSSWN